MPRFITNKWVKVYDQSGSTEDRYKPSKQIIFKTSCYDQIHVILVMHILLLKENLLLILAIEKIMVLMIFLMNFFLIIFFLMEAVLHKEILLKLLLKYIIIYNNNDIRNLTKVISSRNNALFISCISKINGVLIDNAEDLDVVMLVYNLIEYSKNYSKTLGSLWNYYRDEPTYDKKINHYLKSNSFDYKSSVIGKLGDIDNENNTNKEILKLLYY